MGAKSKGGSIGPQKGGQFAKGGGRVGAGPHKDKPKRKPRPNDPKAQKAAKTQSARAQAWSKKSAEFHAKAKAAKTPLEKKAYETAARKASAKAHQHASKAEEQVGKKHKTAQQARAHANRAKQRDEHAKAKNEQHQARTEAKSARDKQKADDKSARDQHKADIKDRKSKWKSDDKADRASKKDDKAWNSKVEKRKAQLEHMDKVQAERKKQREAKKAEFWQKKQKEFQAKAKSATSDHERQGALKAAHVAEGKHEDALAWVHAAKDFVKETSEQLDKKAD